MTTTRCQWRALLKNYPKWNSVRYYFTIWSQKDNENYSTLEKVLKKLVEKERMKNRRNLLMSMVIIDAQNVKNTDTAKKKGYDAKKKISGIKRHIAVGINGLPLTLQIDKEPLIFLENTKTTL